MKKPNYNLDFKQALDIIINGGCVKGENFREGYFLKINSFGQLVLVNANDLYKEETYAFIKQLYNQKYRELSVMTIKELSN